MLVVTTDHLPGYEVRKVLGEVIGATGRVRNPFVENVRMLDGNRHPRMSHYLAQWRREAIDQMTELARERGANAVVGMRFDHREISDMWGEMCAYGTAVYVVPQTGGHTHTTAAAGRRATTGRPRPARGQAAIP